MAKIALCILLFVPGLFLNTSAQISYTFTKTDVGCNNSSAGKIEVTIDNIDPPYTLLWNTGSTSTVLNDLSSGTYTLSITDNSGDDTTLSVIINVLECEMAPEIVFTPNGDGYNDTWFILNYQYFPNALVQVFDRLGALVFEQSGLYEAWDGKSRSGISLPDGSYYFIVYKDKEDKSAIKKGTVSILR